MRSDLRDRPRRIYVPSPPWRNNGGTYTLKIEFIPCCDRLGQYHLGSWRSGQSRLAVDQLALCLRGFESLTAHKYMKQERIESLDELRRKFFDLENSYEIQTSRENGELILAEIAETSDREYHWAFDAESSTWFHFPFAKVIDEFDAIKGTARKGGVISTNLLKPPGKHSSHYHIHPDILISMMVNLEFPEGAPREVLEISQQVPSTEDLLQLQFSDRAKRLQKYQ